MTTLATFRQQSLNVDLGLDLVTDSTGDTDVSFGSVEVRNQAIRVAIAKLWPRMGRLIEESVTNSDTEIEYTLSDIQDVEAVDFIGLSSGYPVDKGNNFRHLFTETTVGAPVSRLRLPATVPTGAFSSMRVIGYMPYTSNLIETDTLDLPVAYEWVVTTGARAEIYRRQLNIRVNYERFNVSSRDNDVTTSEMLTLYQVASREFDDAITAHKRGFVTGHTFRP